MNILLVPKDELDTAWPVALPLLKRANVLGHEMVEEDILRDLKDNLRQLWLGENGTFACLTELHQTMHRKFVLIYMLGGTQVRTWYVDLFLFLYAWAKAQGAGSLEIQYPRRGWKRLLAPLGFIEFDDTLLKEIS